MPHQQHPGIPNNVQDIGPNTCLRRACMRPASNVHWEFVVWRHKERPGEFEGIYAYFSTFKDDIYLPLCVSKLNSDLWTNNTELCVKATWNDARSVVSTTTLPARVRNADWFPGTMWTSCTFCFDYGVLWTDSKHKAQFKESSSFSHLYQSLTCVSSRFL